MRHGYIAITSALIISMLLLVIVLATSVSAFFFRFNALDAQTKSASRTLAEACAESALLKITLTPSYAGGEVLTVAPQATCAIQTIGVQGAERIITTNASVQNTTTYIRLVVTLSPTRIVSWEELPAL